jgi:radical SAM protein with 4Fe4S-binding SPASM domain
MKNKKALLSVDLELTARCNNNCRHCYINVPEQDRVAMENELSFEEIKKIVEEAVLIGAVWCLITGGEPLLRGDFLDIYRYLKSKGLLVSIFTNATLVTEEHVKFFKKYPPRDIEVSVYGVIKKTYERVTRRPGSFDAFKHGLRLLMNEGIKIRLKAMALRSNVHEWASITQFCRERTKDYFRFDPFLHLRYDGNPVRNEEIKAERLSDQEIAALERNDLERFQCLKKSCDEFRVPKVSHKNCNHLFHCGTGKGIFALSYDGLFRPCPSLWHPGCVYDLRKGSLIEAWHHVVPKVRDMQSNRREFLENCQICSLINLCLWCPAYAYLETGEMDTPVDYFCRVAHARAEAIGKRDRSPEVQK